MDDSTRIYIRRIERGCWWWMLSAPSYSGQQAWPMAGGFAQTHDLALTRALMAFGEDERHRRLATVESVKRALENTYLPSRLR